ncbi:hypothetical protein AYK26_04340 [Euryarchaeota archaeon SM23-78]|nr:MAG: hypothetical protein AYK26_04340 [Euryarchaeota archaeon SM23-78]MBW3000726.1 hypothetical protein [Candidatus Woesearchaeota archaeon]
MYNKNIQHKIQDLIRPDFAVFLIFKLGFGLEQWNWVCEQYGLLTNEEQPDRTYAITYGSNGFEYILGRLFCDTQVTVHNEEVLKSAGDSGLTSVCLKGYFYNFDPNDVALSLGVWDKDKHKKDETRFAVLRGPTPQETATYHVRPLLDVKDVVERLGFLESRLMGAGFKPAHSHLDDPNYLKLFI